VLLASLWWLTNRGDTEPTQTHLADHARTDPMMTSQVLRKLEARGLLTRTQHPRDSRARVMHLTRAGTRLVARALADVEGVDEEYFGVLGDGDRRAFVIALQSLA
jgi:DNA-binding MarR family transcriptional regulator